MEKECNFSGWATRNDLLCADGRTIRRDAFKHCDGLVVPLIWNHDHSNPNAVLGQALLENRSEGVYAYGTFNDTDSGRHAKKLIEHGDVRSLSICANQLKQIGGDVVHGTIRELSLVLAGANPGATIDFVMAHSDEEEDELIANWDESALIIYHSNESNEKKETPDVKEEKEMPDDKEKKDEQKESDKEKTIEDVINSMSEEQQNVMYALIAKAVEDAASEEDEDEDEKDEEDEGGNDSMKHNLFDGTADESKVLTHADQESIIARAKMSSVGSLQEALRGYYEEKHGDSLVHGIDEIETLFPDYHNITPGAPEMVGRDQSWVSRVIAKIHKSPYSRIRTRQADTRIAELRAKGYQKKGDEKTVSANIKLIGRTTDPQTVYRKDALNRDDMVDITDFDVVNYQWGIMKENMYEELALAALVGDNRDDGDPDKIHETHIRSIWNDEELYTIHKDVDIEGMKTKLQGTNTGANFGEEFIYAEAIIAAALYAREKFKGSGRPDLFCTPHLVNVMLLARDLNGRRIYDSKTDLAKALNVGEIFEIEQFEGRTRTTKEGAKKNLLGLFANLADYSFGSTKGGELTKFDQFDIDFNQYKYLIEARLSGALTRPYSAIALEEPSTEAAG